MRSQRRGYPEAKTGRGAGDGLRADVPGIGELVALGPAWQLTYRGCGHVQRLARVGLEELGRAVRDIRRHYVRCLLCSYRERLWARTAEECEYTP
jgi:hypothetical protein